MGNTTLTTNLLSVAYAPTVHKKLKKKAHQKKTSIQIPHTNEQNSASLAGRCARDCKMETLYTPHPPLTPHSDDSCMCAFTHQCNHTHYTHTPVGACIPTYTCICTRQCMMQMPHSVHTATSVLHHTCIPQPTDTFAHCAFAGEINFPFFFFWGGGGGGGGGGELSYIHAQTVSTCIPPPPPPPQTNKKNNQLYAMKKDTVERSNKECYLLFTVQQ